MSRLPFFAVSVGKPGAGLPNEDRALARADLLAVSDGAGGGGIYADLWAEWLLDHLPDRPFADFAAMDAWVDGIWEPFYADCEARARRAGGLVLSKFYDEGSFATLAAAWRTAEGWQWVAYGDSVVFCYHAATGRLEHSFTRLADFDRPPFLINFRQPLAAAGYRCGVFGPAERGDVVFCTTDALACYVLTRYELAHEKVFDTELREALDAGGRRAMCLRRAAALRRRDFGRHVVGPLANCQGSETNFGRHVAALVRRGLAVPDDFSLALCGVR